jgi:hypothetical protein
MSDAEYSQRDIHEASRTWQYHISTHALTDLFLKYFLGNNGISLALGFLLFACRPPYAHKKKYKVNF